MTITNRLFAAFIRCGMKFHYLATDHQGTPSEYGLMLEDLDRTYREKVLLRFQQELDPSEVVIKPASILEAVAKAPKLIVDASLVNGPFSTDSVVLRKISNDDRSGQSDYVPLQFLHGEKINRHDKLLLAFQALVLSEVLGDLPAFGTIIHGHDAKLSRVNFRTPAGVTAVISRAVEMNDAVIEQKLIADRFCDMQEP
jgi:hypothetical protein